MEYFLVLPDRRISNSIKLPVTEKELLAKEIFVIKVNKLADMNLTDIISIKFLFNTYFFLSEELEKVFRMYNQDFITIPTLIIDKHNYDLNKVYYIADIKATENVVANKFRVAKDMLINEELVIDKAIHKIHYEKQTFILANRCVVESILRRYPIGIYFQEVKVVGREE